MPIPKALEHKYGMIIGHQINLAKAKGATSSQALQQSKPLADAAIEQLKKKKGAKNG